MASLIGYTGSGASATTVQDTIYVGRFQAPASSTVGRLLFYAATAFDSDDDVKMCIYDDNGGVPDNLVAETGLVPGPASPGSTGWYVAELTSPLAITSGNWYWLGLNQDSGGGMTFGYDSGGSSYSVSDEFTDGFLDPWSGGSSGTSKFRIYGIMPLPPSADTLGYESIGGTDHNITANQHLVCQFTAGYTGIIYSMKAYIKNFASSEYARLTIYSNDLEDPDALLAHTVEVEGTGADGWVTFNLVEPIEITSGETYWVGIHTPSAITVVYATGTYENYRVITDTYSGGSIESWSGGTNVVRKYSIHATQDKPTLRWTGFKDPEIDYGGSYIDGVGNNEIFVTRVLALESLAIDTIGAYLESTFDTGQYIKAAVYSDNGTDVPQNLLGESGAYQGDGTKKLYNLALNSPVRFDADTYYWIGVIYSGDTGRDNFLYSPVGIWAGGAPYFYLVADTYSDGPEDPCNSPADYDDTLTLPIFAQEAENPIVFADAVIENSIGPATFTADAYLQGVGGGAITADAIIEKQGTGSVTANAVISLGNVQQGILVTIL